MAHSVNPDIESLSKVRLTVGAVPTQKVAEIERSPSNRPRHGGRDRSLHVVVDNITISFATPGLKRLTGRDSARTAVYAECATPSGGVAKSRWSLHSGGPCRRHLQS